jgi:hypothetical protein
LGDFFDKLIWSLYTGGRRRNRKTNRQTGRSRNTNRHANRQAEAEIQTDRQTEKERKKNRPALVADEATQTRNLKRGKGTFEKKNFETMSEAMDLDMVIFST